ncbi:MAG: UvrD-helicase domain-containing protein [Deltaproteobacteria bacterium]|nr:UvrD-helicase domain-containing protein [Deltaproteobacteria bacterium]
MTRVARPSSLPPASDRFVVVEASAGTGKTFFLEHRVVDLILAGAELGQILLVTFTEKAVAELRMRIRDVLDRLSRAQTDAPDDCESVWDLDADAKKRLRAAVTAFDHAPIFTIHGFCHRILVEDAFAARRLFEQTQVADEVAFDAAFSALLREQFARDPEDRELLSAFLQTGRTVEHLRDVLLKCARADAPLRRQLNPAAAREAIGRMYSAVGTQAQRDAVCACVTGATDYKYVTSRMSEVGLAMAMCSSQSTTSELLAMVESVRKPLTEMHERLVDRRVSGPAAARAIEAIGTVLVSGSLDESIAAAFLPKIVDRITRDKAEHGQFDYDDMLELVWDALRDDRRGPELAHRMRTRMPWAMIDEFQDTDPVQWGIFRTVWMHAAAKGLTIVGDPKQAIYGFRGADVDTYLKARDEMLRAGATRVALTTNRRSTARLVDAVNHLLIKNLGQPLLDPAHGIAYDEPVRASGDIDFDDGRAPIMVLALDKKGSAESRRVALGSSIGQAIEELRATAPVWTLRGAPQPFSLGQVMVLTRSNNESAEIATALRERGLACALVEPERLFQTREAAELASVLGAIAAPRDRSARLRALRTRFFDVPWTDLVRVVDAPDHHPQIAQLFDWAQLATRRSYETLFRRIVEDSRFAERALVLGGGERAITNTWHLVELLLAEVSRSRSDLHEVVARLRRWIADDATLPDERDVQRAETDVESIRVLTTHKAKGLEAAYVFLYGGTWSFSAGRVQTVRDGAGRALVVGPPDSATKLLLEANSDAENQRLAYVALTRAQLRLFLPLYTHDTVTRGGAYRPIQQAVNASIQHRTKHTPVLFDMKVIQIGAEKLPDPPADALAGFVAPPPPPAGELPPLAPARTGLTMLSYTRLANEVDAAAIAARPGDILAFDPAEFDVDDTAGEVGPRELPPGASAGLLLHDVLEIADLDRLREAPDAQAWARDPQVQQQLVDAARTRGIDRDKLDHAAAVLYQTLMAPLALIDGTTLPSLADAPRFAREIEFTYPLPTGRGLVKGFIDALVAWNDDELWVLDYKSDLLTGDDLARAAEQRVKQHYAVQARLYAIATERMRGGRRLAGLLFQFVRHGIVVPVRITDDALGVWTTWLANLPTPGLVSNVGEHR